MNNSDETSANQALCTEEKVLYTNQDADEDEYPVIWYEPNIDLEEKASLKALLERNKTINLFSDFRKAWEFAEFTGISFILILPSDFDQRKLPGDTKVLKDHFGRRLFDIEEEEVLRRLIKDISNEMMKSFEVYVMFTREDFKNEAPVNEEEEDVTIMCNIKEMAQQFREEFTIIWCDPKMNTETREVLMKELDIEEKNIYTDLNDDLMKRLEDNNDIPYHLIVSGENQGNFLIDKAKELQNLMGLYIYNCPLKVDKKQRNIKVEKTLEALIPRVKEGIRTKSKYKNVFPSFVSIFDDWDKSNINKVHYYLRCFPNFRNRKQAKKDFINLAKRIYQSKKLFEFEKEYSEYQREQILQWYAEESPVYKLINNCLRISTSDSVLYCRLILKDLERAIREEHQHETKRFSGVVYRGAYISDDEFAKLGRNIGKEIEMCGFLSTSKSQATAINFLNLDLAKKVLITILVPDLPLSELDEQGFADLSKFSKEEEILFNVRSRFEVLEVGTIQVDPNSECRHVVLFYGAQFLRKFMTKEKPLINLEINLTGDLKCGNCESKNELFAFNTEEKTEIACKGCFLRDKVQKNTFLVPIENKNETILKMSFRGKMLNFDENSKGTQFYGYKCNDCLSKGKERYYKLIDGKGENTIIQCIECFKQNKGKTVDYLLISEKNPYNFWKSSQDLWEEADTEFKAEEFERIKGLRGADVFLEVQSGEKCVELCTKFLKSFAMKRKTEQRKLEHFFIFARGSENLGDHQKALEYHMKALEIKKFIYGEKHSYTASSLNIIAEMYRGLGKHQEALEYHMKVLDIMKSRNGETHLQTANSYNNIGLVYTSLGRTEKALEYHMKALNIRKSIHGETHPDTASSFNNIAEVYRESENYQEALDFHIKGLNIYTSIYGETHPLTAISCSNIGLVYVRLERHQEALDFHVRALNIRKFIYGEIHLETTVSFNNIGLVYASLGKYQEALDYYMKALNILASNYGKTHPVTATTLYNIAEVYCDLSKHQEALEYHMKALDIRKSLYGETHPDTAISFNNIAEVYRELGDYQEALYFHIKGLNTYKSIYGEMHPQTVMSINNIAEIYNELGLYHQALECYMKALEINKFIYGDTHLQTAISFYKIAYVEKSLGRREEALEFHIKALDIHKSLSGKTNPDTATSISKVKSMYHGWKKHQEALKSLTKVLFVFFFFLFLFSLSLRRYFIN